MAPQKRPLWESPPDIHVLKKKIRLVDEYTSPGDNTWDERRATLAWLADEVIPAFRLDVGVLGMAVQLLDRSGGDAAFLAATAEADAAPFVRWRANPSLVAMVRALVALRLAVKYIVRSDTSQFDAVVCDVLMVDGRFPTLVGGRDAVLRVEQALLTSVQDYFGISIVGLAMMVVDKATALCLEQPNTLQHPLADALLRILET